MSDALCTQRFCSLALVAITSFLPRKNQFQRPRTADTQNNMHFLTYTAAVLASASLVIALPRSGSGVEKRCTEHDILKALAGTYSLVNTTRYISQDQRPTDQC
jgi:hypothetical protein